MTIVFNVFEDKIDILDKDKEQNMECIEIVTTIKDLFDAIEKYDITEASIFNCK